MDDGEYLHQIGPNGMDRRTDRLTEGVIPSYSSHTQGGSYSYNNYYYRILNLHDLLHDMCTIYCIVCLFCCVHHLRRQTVLLPKTLWLFVTVEQPEKYTHWWSIKRQRGVKHEMKKRRGLGLIGEIGIGLVAPPHFSEQYSQILTFSSSSWKNIDFVIDLCIGPQFC